MTREQHIELINFILKRHRDKPDVAERIVDAFELEILREIPAALPAQVPDPPAVAKLPPPPAAVVPGPTLPPAQELMEAVQENPEPCLTADMPADNLIVLPGSPEAQKPKPRVRTLPKVPTGERTRIYWQIGRLVEVLNEKSPQTIVVMVKNPQGQEIPVQLEKNVLAMHGMAGDGGFAGAKLIYKHRDYGDDMSVTETFWTTDQELAIPEAMERLRMNAQKLYSPRPRTIVPMQQAIRSTESILAAGSLAMVDSGKF